MDGAARPAKRLRPSPPAPDDAIKQLQALYRGYRCRNTVSLAERRREKAAANAKKAADSEEAAIAARARSAEYRQLTRHCPDADASKLARVDLALEKLVGLTPLKEYCASVRRDCLARAAVGDAPLVRNVLISGNLGSGKKLAGQLLCDLLRALGVSKGMGPTHTTLDQMALDVRRDMSCVVVDGLEKVESARARVDQILSNFPNHCFIFVGATTAVEALHGGVAHFRKVDPAWLQLPNYTPSQLAAIAGARLAERGYSLADGLGASELKAALCSTWARDVLAMRNAHLASELVERSVTNRNRRLPISALLAAPPLLIASDLGLASEGLDSLLAERAAVDDEIEALVGMAPLKACLVELRAKVEFVARGADPRLLEGCLNIVLTGNPGAGKTTAARLLFRALRAYGLLKSNVFVERNALELKGTHVGWTCPLVKEMVQAALGGCLFLDEAYALTGGGKDGDRGDSFSDEALRTLLTETENNRTSLCVVLAGYRAAMDGLMRADPGLVRRFPTTIHLEDYSPAELAAIARQTAATRFGLQFAPGLEAALASHIAVRHGEEIHSHNASLSVSLVEAAINRLAMRCVGLPPSRSSPVSMPTSPAVLGAEGVAGGALAARRLAEAEASTLVASDFLIEATGPAAASGGAQHKGAATERKGGGGGSPSLSVGSSVSRGESEPVSTRESE